MRPCVDIRVDAHRDPGAHSPRLRRAVDAFQLAGGLGVDRLQPELHGTLDLFGRFAHAAEHDVLHGGNPARIASSTSPIELASTALPASRSREMTANDEFAFIA